MNAGCLIDGCSRPHRARGLCASHYNQKHAQRKYVDVTCPTCGETVTKRDDGPSTRRFCSMICRDLWRLEQPDDPMYRTRPKPEAKPTPTFCPIVSRDCAECGVAFIHRTGRRRYCSNRCAWKAKSKRRSNRHLSRRIAIFERDGYICWICDGPTSPTYDQHDPASPTVDHLIPQSLGGTDEDDNLATAHMLCNSYRGASLNISPAA